MRKSVYEPRAELAASARVKSMVEYQELYQRSIENPREFWTKIAGEFHWETPIDPENVLSYNFDVRKGKVFIKWFEGATTNICYNLLDRNIKNGLGDRIAFYWEGNETEDRREVTYGELLRDVCKLSNVLRSRGVGKGDRVVIYMPVVPEAVVAMLACARIGAIHSVVFAGFSKDSLAERMHDCQAKVLITADFFYRAKKLLRLKETCDVALEGCKALGHEVATCVVVRHLTSKNHDEITPSPNFQWVNGRDVWWHEAKEDVADFCNPEWVSAEHPIFMLYTSGSTGKPKGVLHTTGGYMIFAATTHKYIFDYRPGDVYWCTADVGWITGHTYSVYGPLANGATSVIYEGTPYYPNNDRFWSIIERYKVNQFYTAPTVIRSLIKFGDEPVKKHDLSSLKVLGSIGEPINPEAWHWLYDVVGGGRCSIVDTFLQTETGGNVISPLPGATPMKPGSATLPFFGAIPELLSEEGELIEGEGAGCLVFRKPWPGMMRTLFGNHERFESAYFSRFPGYYFTGDGARRDEDGYIWVTGRVDDMLNVSGHLLSTACVESVLTEHPSVAEAAAVARPHETKGQCLYCFVTPKQGVNFSDALVKELKQLVRERISAIAVPDEIQHAPGLPKTRSGKIMRRILRKVAVNDREIGDTSTLIDESVVEALFNARPKSLNQYTKDHPERAKSLLLFDQFLASVIPYKGRFV